MDTEAERDEQELNETVQHVVTSMFPVRASPMEDQSDEHISKSIAEYEANPLHTMEDDEITARLRSPSVHGSNSVADGGSLSELEKLQATHADEIARLKKQYVTGLLEYKKLVIEQYERRQNEIQQHHRIEIENLILLVQDKFKRELERRGESVMQAKESLKLLYRAMQMGDGSVAGRRGSRFDFLSEDGEESGAHDGSDRDEEPVPLKSILRAAVFAMSTSKRRNDEASSQISTMHSMVGKKRSMPRKPVVKVVVKQDKAPELPPLEPQKDSQEHDWAAFLKSMRANRDDATTRNANTKSVVVHVACQVDERDFVIFELKGLRGSHVSPENVEGYVLPSTALLGGSSSPATDAESRSVLRRSTGSSGGNGNGNGVLCLTEGALLADSVVRELRGLLPFLPPGAYFLSGALRHQLMIEMIRFYSDLGHRNAVARQEQHRQSQHKQSQQKQSQQRDAEDTDADVEVVLGSPRDTPFLRRKAVEGVARLRQQQRRDQLSNGALAMLQPPPSAASATAHAGQHGFVTSSVVGSMSHVRLR